MNNFNIMNELKNKLCDELENELHVELCDMSYWELFLLRNKLHDELYVELEFEIENNM